MLLPTECLLKRTNIGRYGHIFQSSGRRGTGSCSSPLDQGLWRHPWPSPGVVSSAQPLRLGILSFDWKRAKDPPLALGHASIKAALQHRFPSSALSIEDLVFNVSPPQGDSDALMQQVLGDVVGLELDVLAIGAFVWNEAHVQLLLRGLMENRWESVGQRRSRPCIIMGGPQVTYSAKGSLESNYPGVDVFIRGYAEEAMCAVIGAMHQQQGTVRGASSGGPLAAWPVIEGVHVAGSDDLGTQARVQMDALPSPYLPIEAGDASPRPAVLNLNTGTSFMRWETQRGCPFRCNFCQHRDMYPSGPLGARKRMGSSRIEAEIDAITAQGTITDLAVVDPTFNSGPAHLETLHRLADRGYGGKIALQSRFEMMKPQYLEACLRLRDSCGADTVLEFGIQTIHKAETKAIERPNNLKLMAQWARQLREQGLPFEISLIYGLPHQTLDSFRASIAFAQDLGPTRLVAWPLMILRGTELERQRSVYGLQEEVLSSVDLSCDLPRDRLFEGIPHVTSSDSFTKDDWIRMKELASKL